MEKDFNFKDMKKDSVTEVVQNIFLQVAASGDEAVRQITQKYDKKNVTNFVFNTDQEVTQKLDPQFDDLILQTIESIKAFHEKTALQSFSMTTNDQIQITNLVSPIPSVGLYIPGGKSPLVSTLMMLVIPAQIAKVKFIAVFTPPQKEGLPSPIIHRTCQLLGIKNIYCVGGAQAIAAMAMGTESLPQVEKIIGPGNDYVTQAKLVASKNPWNRAIDGVAGPSELLLYLQSEESVSWAAFELLTQVEHGQGSWSLALVSSKKLKAKLTQKIDELRYQYLIAQELIDRIEIEIVESKELAELRIQEVSPEHLCIDDYDMKLWMNSIPYAGAVYLNSKTSVVLGDYGIGPNHTLPTGGWASRTSAISVRDFQKTTHIVQNLGRENSIWKTVSRLANLEMMDLHSLAALKQIQGIEK